MFDVNISMEVTEYRAEIVQNQNETQWVAAFPEGVDYRTQYGNWGPPHGRLAGKISGIFLPDLNNKLTAELMYLIVDKMSSI